MWSNHYKEKPHQKCVNILGQNHEIWIICQFLSSVYLDVVEVDLLQFGVVVLDFLQTLLYVCRVRRLVRHQFETLVFRHPLNGNETL